MGVAPIPVGTVLLGKYRVERVIGRGGMGVVVEARHLGLGEVVAIKLLLDEIRLSSETVTRFQREAQAAARLRSAHVVRVSDIGLLDDQRPYMVMEMLHGRDLGAIVKGDGPLPSTVAADLAIQVCEALTEAHAAGIVHRDIKPTNLFVSEDDGRPMVKILDFGIAKVEEQEDFSLTRTSSMLGTPGYMSPEQLRSSRTVDPRTDIWSIGIVLYEVLEGRRPFTGETFSELCLQIGVDEAPPLVRAPPALAGIVMRCLEKAPDRRFQSVAELAVALAPFAGDPAAAQAELDRMSRVLRSMGMLANLPTPTPMLAMPRIAAQTPPALPVAEPTAAVITTPSRPSRVTDVRGRSRWVIALVAVSLIAIGVVVVVLIDPFKSGSTEIARPREDVAGSASSAPPREDKPPPPPEKLVEVEHEARAIGERVDVPAVPIRPTTRPATRPGTQVRNTGSAQTNAGSATVGETEGKPDAGKTDGKPDAGKGSSVPCDPYTSRTGC